MATTAPKAPSAPAITASGSSDKKILPAFLLRFFLGCFGAHRFFIGKIGTGILQIVLLVIGILLLIPLIALGIWVLVDFMFIIIGKFTDKEGRPLTEWT